MRFLTGDELGNIKSLRYFPVDTTSGQKTETKTIHEGNTNGKVNAVQALAVAATNSDTLLAAGRADGSAAAYSLQDDKLEVIHEWKEFRLKSDQAYVGLCVSGRGIYSCTSNGALRLTSIGMDNDHPTPQLTSLPTRLCDWRLSSDAATFAYGGEEVDLSVWNTERAFTEDAASTASNKRKRRDTLFPGEVWRAKNLPNDFLGLRQPIRLLSLTYISSSPSVNHHHLLAGTQFGDLRRYDTRAARRPVANWKTVGKIGGIKVIEKGFAEHETFISDHGGNLFSLDLRTGGIVYGYKGLAGAVTSIATSPSLLASTALDRFSRIHSTFAPPPKAGQQQERKGEVLDKIFMKSTPTVVIWDQEVTEVSNITDAEDDVWNDMARVNDDSDEELGDRNKKKGKQGNRDT